MKKKHYSEIEADLICQRFANNSSINPETGGRLMYGMGPYLAYKNFCQRRQKVENENPLAKREEVILNIILNTPPIDLLPLYQINTAYRKVLDNHHTLELLYDKYIAKDYPGKILEYFDDFVKDLEDEQEIDFAEEGLKDNLALYRKLTENKTFDNFLEAYNLLLSFGNKIGTNLVKFHNAIKSKDIVLTLEIVAIIDYFILILILYYDKNLSRGQYLTTIKKLFKDSNILNLDNKIIFSFGKTIKLFDDPGKTNDVNLIDDVLNKILKQILKSLDKGIDFVDIINNIFTRQNADLLKSNLTSTLTNYINNPYRI